MSINSSGDPRVILNGVLDQSIPELVFTPAKKAIHTPLSFIFAEEGPEDVAFRTIGDNAKQMYGRKVFDLDTPFATSYTPFYKLFNELGNSQITHRLVPDDAKAASLRYYAELLETNVPKFKRNADGSYMYGPDNRPIQEGTVPGIMITWRKGQITSEVGGFGAGKTYEGQQVSNIEGKGNSTIYPIWDWEASSRCRKNNDRGFRLSCPNAKSLTPVDKNLVNDIGSRIMTLQMVDTLVPGTSPSVIKTLQGANEVSFSLEPKAYSNTFKMNLDMDRVIMRNYRNMNPKEGMPLILSPVKGFHLYRENLELILNKAKEILNSPDGGELGLDNIYMIDPFTGLDLDGNPYNAFIVDAGVEGGIVLSEKHTHFMMGGTDGDTSQTNYDLLVRKEMARFGDGPVPYLDVLKYPVRFLWDSGLEVETKQAMTNFISKRKDTILGLSTHVFGQPANDMQKENAMKISLSAMLAANPESPKYGTAAFRGFLMGHSYMLNDDSWEHRVPAIYTLAKYTAMYAGSPEGFKREFRFDRGELAMVNDGYDINLTYKPSTVYATDWEKGLINIRAFDEYSYNIPALYTVYPHDRSILNGYFPAIIAADLEYELTRTWSEMSGSQSLTDAEIIRMMTSKIKDRTRGKYDDVCDVTPKPYLSAEDKANGGSISCDVFMDGNVLKGVHKYTIVARRRVSDATA